MHCNSMVETTESNAIIWLLPPYMHLIGGRRMALSARAQLLVSIGLQRQSCNTNTTAAKTETRIFFFFFLPFRWWIKKRERNLTSHRLTPFSITLQFNWPFSLIQISKLRLQNQTERKRTQKAKPSKAEGVAVIQAVVPLFHSRLSGGPCLTFASYTL